VHRQLLGPDSHRLRVARLCTAHQIIQLPSPCCSLTPLVWARAPGARRVRRGDGTGAAGAAHRRRRVPGEVAAAAGRGGRLLSAREGQRRRTHRALRGRVGDGSHRRGMPRHRLLHLVPGHLRLVPGEHRKRGTQAAAPARRGQRARARGDRPLQPDESERGHRAPASHRSAGGRRLRRQWQPAPGCRTWGPGITSAPPSTSMEKIGR
jgi:hypothetical protein